MAVAYGDSWTNLCTPFWALPMANVLGIKVRDFLWLYADRDHSGRPVLVGAFLIAA